MKVVGEIWGCQIIITNKVKTNATVKEKQHFIVKPGALRLLNKRGTLVEGRARSRPSARQHLCYQALCGVPL